MASQSVTEAPILAWISQIGFAICDPRRRLHVAMRPVLAGCWGLPLVRQVARRRAGAGMVGLSRASVHIAARPGGAKGTRG